jgi:PAS domain S-box-containing protein
VNEAVLIAIGTVAGSLLTALGNFVITLRKSRGDAAIAEREQISREYKTLIEQLQANLTTERSERQAQSKLLNDSVERLREHGTQCQIEREQLKGDLRVLQGEVNQLRIANLGQRAANWVDTLVIVDDEGKVVEWNQAATLLFHYTREEIVGKALEILIPEPLRQRYRDASYRLRATNTGPTDQPFFFNGVTKEGKEVPVEITLSGWKSGPRWFYGAAIRRRYAQESARENEN